MTKDRKKLQELNTIMDNALGGATAGLIGLDTMLGRMDIKMLSSARLDTLYSILQQRSQLQKSIELLSRPVDIKKDGTLFYGGSR